MSSIMRCRGGLMALSVMRDAPVLMKVANPSSQDRTAPPRYRVGWVARRSALPRERFSPLAHSVISLRYGIWSLPGHSGHWSSPRQSTSIDEYAPWSATMWLWVAAQRSRSLSSGRPKAGPAGSLGRDDETGRERR